MKLNKWTISAAVLFGLSLAYAQTAPNPSCVTFENGTHSMKLCSTGSDVTVAADGGAAISVIGKPGPAGPAGATGATGPMGPAGPQGPAGTSTNAQFTSFNCTNLTMSPSGISGAGCTFK